MYKTASEIADRVLEKLAYDWPSNEVMTNSANFTQDPQHGLVVTDPNTGRRFAMMPGSPPGTGEAQGDVAGYAKPLDPVGGGRTVAPGPERGQRSNNSPLGAVQPQVTPADALRDRWMAEQEAAGRTLRDMSPEEKMYGEALLGPGAKPPQPPMRTPQADVESLRDNSVDPESRKRIANQMLQDMRQAYQRGWRPPAGSPLEGLLAGR